MPATSFSNLITFSRGTNATVTDSTGRLTYAPHNLLTFSEQFDNAAWVKTATTVTANTSTAPDGTTTADTINEGTTLSVHSTSQAFSSVSGIAYTISVYLKNVDGRYAQLLYGSAGHGSTAFANFDLQTGTVGTVGATATASITSVGSGWYRCTMTATATGTGASGQIAQITSATSARAENYTGTSKTLLLWGAQVEAVTYQTTPSTYYPTTVKNLLGFSQDFSNAAWSKVAASITGCPYVNPVDGLFTAQKLMEDTANTQHYVQQAATTIAGAPCTASVYVKGDGRNVRVFCYQAASPFTTIGSVTVDLSNGSVLSGSGTVSSLGNGWYRISVTGAAVDTSTRLRIDLASGATLSYTGDGNSGVYIYGAQLSDSASLDPYVPTPAAAPSSTAYYGPRFDYDPVTLAAKGILIEEARTNLLLRSQDFNNALWVANTSTVSPNADISPDGSQNADRWVSDPGSTSHYLGQTYTSSASISYTFSVWVKSATGSNQTFRLFVQSSFASGDLTASTSWQRFTLTLSSSSAGSFVAGLSRNGSNDPVDLFVYGAQLEAGAFATSYIPTVASTVTRSADVATITGSLFSGWYNQSEGSIIFRGTIFADQGATTVDFAQISNGASNSFAVDVGMYGVSAPLFQVTDSTTQASLDLGSITLNTAFNIAGAYKVNDFAGSVNGGTAVTDTSGTVPSGMVRLGIGVRLGGVYMNGHIRSIQYIPNATSATQLQAATS